MTEQDELPNTIEELEVLDRQLAAQQAAQSERLKGSVTTKAPERPLKEGFYARNVEPLGMEAVKGVPVAGGYVQQTPEMTDFENRHPWVAGTANAAGTFTGMAPIARAGSYAVQGLPWLARAAGGIGGNSGLAYADAKARGASNDDASMAALLAGGLQAIPTVGAKVISPGLPEKLAEGVSHMASGGVGAGLGAAAQHAAGLPLGDYGAPILGAILTERAFGDAFKPWLMNRAAQNAMSAPISGAIAPATTQALTQRALAAAQDDENPQRQMAKALLAQ